MKALLLIALAALAWAQNPSAPQNPTATRWRVTESTAKLTIQANGTNDAIYFEVMDAKCSATATLTWRTNGTAATTTAAVAKTISGGGSPPSVFTTSDVGTGTVGKTWPVTADIPVAFTIYEWSLPAQGPTNRNWTVEVSSGTCVFNVDMRRGD